MGTAGRGRVKGRVETAERVRVGENGNNRKTVEGRVGTAGKDSRREVGKEERESGYSRE